MPKPTSEAQLSGPAPKGLVRLHGFALVSGIGWLIDFALFTSLAWAGIDLFKANLVGATCAVTFVFISGRRFIFYNARTRLSAAIAGYALWNVAAIFLASLAVDAIARLLSLPCVMVNAQSAFAITGIESNPTKLVAPVAKILITPITMYCNFVVTGLIIERRLHLL